MPVGTPGAVVERLNAEVNKALSDPATRTALLNSAQEPVGGSPSQFSTRLKDEFAKYGSLTRELDLKVQ